MDTINLIDKTKELRCVSIYNKLFKMINDGVFPENTKLPSEPVLAKELGVSRTTLRQALSLLHDDGLVKNIHGKGNFIIKENTTKKYGLEKIGHIVYKCINDNIDKVELDFKLEPPTDYFTKILGEKPVAAVTIDRWYKHTNEAIAYTFSILPIETISLFNIDLNDKNSITKFMEEDIYNNCSHTNVNLKFSKSGNFATKKYQISSEKQFYLIEEHIFKNTDLPIAVNKHYLPLSNASINFYPEK